MSRIADVLKELNALGAVGAAEASNTVASEEVQAEVQEELPVLESSDDSYWVDITGPAEPELPDAETEELAPDVGVLKLRIKRAMTELEFVLTQLNNIK